MTAILETLIAHVIYLLIYLREREFYW